MDLSVALLDVVGPLAQSRRSGVQPSLSANDFPVERPRSREHGDWSSNAALRFAKAAGMSPRELAAEIVRGLEELPGVASVDIAGPGFVNIVVEAAVSGAIAREIVEAGAVFGSTKIMNGEVINLEFVSANPTGPIHLGGTRCAAVGDSLGRILASQGAAVTREYYFNDHGAQIDRFARSLVASWVGEPPPEDGYVGDYIDEIARQVVEVSAGELAELGRAQQQEVFRRVGVGLMFDQIRRSLHDFGVIFDVYFHEDDLHTDGAVGRALLGGGGGSPPPLVSPLPSGAACW